MKTLLLAFTLMMYPNGPGIVLSTSHLYISSQDTEVKFQPPKEGDEVRMGEQEESPLVAIDEKSAEVFKVLMQQDMNALFARTQGENWYTPALKVSEAWKTLGKLRNLKAVFPVVNGTKAKVLAVSAETGLADMPHVCQVEILSGQYKGKTVWWSPSFDKRGLRLFFDPDYLYKGKTTEPVTLAYDLSVWKIYSHAADSGDSATIQRLKREERIFTPPVNTRAQPVEKASIVDWRMEILDGPMKGKKGWTVCAFLNGKPASDKKSLPTKNKPSK